MSMANFNFASMAAQLSATDEEGVAFQDKTLTWDTAEDVKDVVQALNNQKNVHYLKLDGNTLGVEAAQAIGEALQKHPEFRKAFWKNMFTRRLKTEIPQALKHLGNGLIAAGAKLNVLDLSDNALGPNGMTGLEEFLRSSVCFTLQELHLNNCGLGPEGGRMLSQALLDLYANAKKAGSPLQLRVFVAGRNRLENVGAKALSQVFETLKTLEEISMPQNSIYHVGIAALAKGFKQNPYLRVLNMNDNTLSVKGASSIADILPHIPLLREINFGDCLLKTNGAYAFGEILMDNNEHLEVVDLGFNDINSDGGLLLVAAMKNKEKLKSFNLDGNCFGKEGCQQIKTEMASAKHPEALQDFEEDHSEDEDENESGREDDADGDENQGEYSSEYGEEEQDDEEEGDYDHEHANDTTEEAEEDDEEYANAADETAYVTMPAYKTAIFNDTVSSTDNGNKISAEEFCLDQKPFTLQQFESLEATNKLQALHDIINQFNEDNHLLLLIFTTLKCAHLAKSSKAALDLAVALYQAAFDYAIKTKQESRVVDFYLKQLGLMHSEEPFKPDYDVKSCRYALREALSRQEFANENVKNTFKVFLEKLD